MKVQNESDKSPVHQWSLDMKYLNKHLCGMKRNNKKKSMSRSVFSKKLIKV